MVPRAPGVWHWSPGSLSPGGTAFRGSVLLAAGADWHEPDLPFLQSDLEAVAGFEVQLLGVGLAHHQVAVEVHPRSARDLAAGAFGGLASADVHALGFQQSLIEGREVEAFLAVLGGADVTGSPHQIGVGGMPSSWTLASRSLPWSMEGRRFVYSLYSPLPALAGFHLANLADFVHPYLSLLVAPARRMAIASDR